METRLDLVNHLLQVVGERRVLTLETGHPSVEQAQQALDSWKRDFLGRGWWFNTNKMVDLTPNVSGEILIPAETLSFSITKHQRDWMQKGNKEQFVKRGQRLYDSFANTFIHKAAVKADLVINLDVEDLPQVAASYLKHWAAEQYYVDDDGDMNKAAKLSERTMLAWNALKSEEMRVQSTNALDSPAATSLRYRISNTGVHHRANYIGGIPLR